LEPLATLRHTHSCVLALALVLLLLSPATAQAGETLGFLGVGYGPPTKLHAGGELWYGPGPRSGIGGVILAVAAEAGSGGVAGGLGVGYAGNHSVSIVVSAGHTLAESGALPAKVGFLGAELSYSPLLNVVVAHVGVARPTSGGRSVFTWRLGVRIPIGVQYLAP
jgi:hypothetical protein